MQLFFFFYVESKDCCVADLNVKIMTFVLRANIKIKI